MKKLSLYIGVVIIATVLSPTLVFASVWEIEIVDSAGWITLNSLAIDSLDKVHIIYSGDYELKYATNFLGSWAIESVACIGGGYENEKLATSLALDSNDKVYMGYYGCDGDGNYTTNASGSWVTESTGVGPEGISLALDSNDKVHFIGFRYLYSGPFWTQESFEYATNASGLWVVENLDVLGSYSSLAVDSNDKIHIIIISSANLLYITNASGSWVTESTGVVGPEGISLALDSNDNAHISYANRGFNYSIGYATNASGAWVMEPIDSITTSYQSALALDSNDKVHIGYCDWNTGEIKYATNTSGSWVVEKVDTVGYYSYVSLALDSLDRIHISYSDYYSYNHSDLKYARQYDVIDSDDDGIPDNEDNCPNTSNPSQANSDNDSHGDACDNCPDVDNENQADSDSDGIGDVCEPLSAADIPTLSEWGMIIFMTIIMGLGVAALFRRRLE
jgi:hypothetical protein